MTKSPTDNKGACSNLVAYRLVITFKDLAGQKLRAHHAVLFIASTRCIVTFPRTYTSKLS